MRVRMLVLLVWAGACGGGEPEGTTTTSGAEATADDDWDDDMPEGPVVSHAGSAIETLGITPPDVPWSEMSRGDREMYMVGKVMPVMQELFARHDAERFGTSFACETCHGADMREVEFRMPPRASLPVPPVGSPGYARLERRFPEVVRFMRETVTPAMGTLIGAEAYSCNGCHPSAP